MLELGAFLQANIIPIYFIYGLAHFITGFAVALESGRASQLRLSSALPFLAAFGITHGINEWIEMFSLIADQIPTVAQEPQWAEMAKVGWKALSFVFLFFFGTRLLAQLVVKHKRWLDWLPVLAVVIYFLVSMFIYLITRRADGLPLRIELSEVWTNYFLGVPAALFSAAAMLAQRRAFLREGMPQFGRDLVGAALALAWYALLDQMIDATAPIFPTNFLNRENFLALSGVPIQVFRILAITALAFFVIRMLRVFEVEYVRRLDAANRARFDAQEEAKRELSVMFETCRLLGTSLDVTQILNDFLTQVVTLLDPMIGATIYLFDPSQRALTIRARRVRLGMELTAAQQTCSQNAGRRAFDASELAYETDLPSNTSFIAVPLIAQNKTIGALCLAHRAAFSNYAVIQTLARQLGIALENARLYEQVQEKEKLRGELLERTVAAQEEERKRIARELHDETGQWLTALGVGLGGVEQTVAQDPERAQYQIAELKNMTMGAIENLRQFVSDLRPTVLDDMGLVPALRWFAHQYAERAKLAVTFEAVGAKRRLPSQVETVLFRIGQEGLNNVGRHARATHAAVRLEFFETRVVLTVRDDGRGFAVNEILETHSARKAWGLLGIQERVNLVGGKFSVESEPGKGTQLVVEIPTLET